MGVSMRHLCAIRRLCPTSLSIPIPAPPPLSLALLMCTLCRSIDPTDLLKTHWELLVHCTSTQSPQAC